METAALCWLLRTASIHKSQSWSLCQGLMWVCWVVFWPRVALAAWLHRPYEAPVANLVFRAALFFVADGVDVWNVGTSSAGELVSPGMRTVFCSMTISRMHLEGHLLIVMVDLHTAAPCWGRNGDAGSVSFSLLLHVNLPFTLRPNKKLEVSLWP